MLPSSQARDFDPESPRLNNASISGSHWPAESRLRGLRWRVLLGVLPPCPAPIDSLRRAAANGRRRYAELRRSLIVDPRSLEDVQKSESLIISNPLSQDPESVWGRYFRNAEIEKIIENDLTRLYPEHGNFFQSYGCQTMLRRILLVWALVHPEYGYKQGMHEVLAPLIYVLHWDVTHLLQVRQRYQDPFEDRFDTPHENRFAFYSERRQGASAPIPQASLNVSEDHFLTGNDWVKGVHPDDLLLVEVDDFGFNLKTMVLGSDSYGAEGELGALLSRRFIEHDAFSMFDSLMRGSGGEVVLADYFSTVNEGRTGLPPVLEASAEIYRFLAAMDISLYIHLVGLGVEPQFFALRWLRVLFGREFDLEKLLLLWDAIFSASPKCKEGGDLGGAGRSSARGSFITSFAVSMILHLRSILLASSNATTCLQKLLSFPKIVDIKLLIENAKVLLVHSDELLESRSLGSKYFQISGPNFRNDRCMPHSPSFKMQIYSGRKGLRQVSSGLRERSLPSPSESYWEEKWMSSILPTPTPEQSAPPSGCDSTTVPRSASFPEGVLRNTGPGGSTEGPSDAGMKTSQIVTDTHNMESFSSGDTSYRKKETIHTERNCPGYAEGEHKEKDNVEHVCIHAVDGAVDANRVDSPTECCNLCGTGLHIGLQVKDQRRQSDDQLFVSASKELSESICTEEDPKMKAVVKTFRDKQSRVSLHALGYSMVESIQVLEDAVASIFTDYKIGISDGETTQISRKDFLNAEDRSTAIKALTNLRKISSILLSM
ncbi:hypothetical protein KP509_35G031500 [Ceratopteris richardii]|uniref:Rab-GAP TBC domain-containing protein n=1 Tax=Ceratopteris richardii TaxID=49495 RepID=A0A8T2QFP6_CERRI|nr:hypothetical protein KP509_35G031500 [Ceratopteris richardii]